MGNWILYDSGSTIGEIGTENGEIIFDEEYANSSRITLERMNSIAHSITCGIYGLTFYTTFATTETEAKEKYDGMKEDIKEFIDTYTEETDVATWVKQFVEKW